MLWKPMNRVLTVVPPHQAIDACTARGYELFSGDSARPV